MHHDHNIITQFFCGRSTDDDNILSCCDSIFATAPSIYIQKRIIIIQFGCVQSNGTIGGQIRLVLRLLYNVYTTLFIWCTHCG